MKKILLLTLCVALFACTDEPAPIRVESLTLNDDTITLTVGDYQSLEAVVLPVKAENQTVHWSSSNVKVATVADGLVMAVSVGTATITAISDDGGKKATCQVTVNPRPVLVTGVSLTEDNVRVFLGHKLTLRAIITPSDASNQGLLWTTSRRDVATVTDGVVSAVGLGKAKITVETKDGGFKAECSIKVTEECQTQTKGPVTLDLTTVMATTAAFSGTLDVNQLSDYDMNGEGIGFIYAPVGKPLVIESAQKVKLSSVDSENAFSHTLTDLKYDTEYQYTIFLYKNNVCQYGEVQKFRTADVSIEVEEVAVTPVTATFNGKLNRDVSASAITFGIQYSTSETFSSSATKSISITENSFSKTVSGLEKGTTYYYRTYVCQNGTYEYSTKKSFKTADVSVVITDVKPSQTSVTIKGKVDPASACEEVTVGILLNTSTTVTSSSYVKRLVLSSSDIAQDGTFTKTITGLTVNQTYNYRYYVLNNGAYSYGEISSFKTSNVTTTLSVSNITPTNAVLKGKISPAAIKSEVTIGVFVNTSSTVDKDNYSKKYTLYSSDIASDGSFTVQMTGLNVNTTHYIRSYVISNNVYVYGETQNFKTADVTVTLTTDNITSTSVTINGKCTPSSIKNEVEIGILVNTSSSISSSYYSKKYTLTSSEISSSGSFTISLNDLKPERKHYFCSYIRMNGVYGYGEIKSFTTAGLVAPMLNTATDITEVSATISGTVSLAAGTASDLEYGFQYSTSSDFSSGVISKKITDIDSENKFSISIASLVPETAHYYRSYIRMNGVYGYGEIKSFTTAGLVAPMLNTATDITEVSATISGTVSLAAGTASDLEYGFQYSTSSDFSSGVISKKITDIDSENKFSISIASLVPETAHYYRSYIRMNGVYGYGEIKSFTTAGLVAPMLNTATDITEVSATISGTVSLAAGTASDLEYGFQYSTSSDFSSGVISKKITDIDSENKFSISIASLVQGTAHYYRSYIRMNGVYGYGEIKSFTTAGLVAPMLNTATDITEVSATISGTVSLAAGTASDLEYGFQYSTSSDFSSGVISKKITDIDSENKFSISIASLVQGTAHYYRSYIRMNGVYGYGEIKSFTTLLNPYTYQADLSVSSASDLSSSGSANSYIVSKSGTYKFKPVKGNSTTSVGSVSVAETLWETFGTSTEPLMGDLINAITYKDGYIAFQTASTFQEGNAVIAAKDANGNILWSWHIWLTDQPQEQEYYNNAGTMMDRNLGATSATPGDVGALGLLYQWGRKDPFLGSSSISSSTLAKSTITWPSAVSSNSSNGTIAYATAHPTTFITLNWDNYDWYYTGSSSTNNTRWTTSSRAKSIYDPCPIGWRVPDGGSNGVWSKALGSSSYFTNSSLYNSTNQGMNFSGKFGSASTIWYPASGFRRSNDDGSLGGVGNNGNYCSASPYSHSAYILGFYYDGNVYPISNGTRATGYSVRCVKE